MHTSCPRTVPGPIPECQTGRRWHPAGDNERFDDGNESQNSPSPQTPHPRPLHPRPSGIKFPISISYSADVNVGTVASYEQPFLRQKGDIQKLTLPENVQMDMPEIIVGTDMHLEKGSTTSNGRFEEGPMSQLSESFVESIYLLAERLGVVLRREYDV